MARVILVLLMDDPPAAMRYTETRLSKVSQYLVDDINKDTVVFKSNYDETENEPEIFLHSILIFC